MNCWHPFLADDNNHSNDDHHSWQQTKPRKGVALTIRRAQLCEILK